MDPALRLEPLQDELTPAQEAEACHFAAERIAEQLSTEPLDEQETEQLLRQVYAAVGFPPPEPILWLDGPLELLPDSELPIRCSYQIRGIIRTAPAKPFWSSYFSSSLP